MAQIGGVPRERRSSFWVFNNTFLRRKRLYRVAAPLGIVGKAGTGRKTLAYRFANMGEGVFEREVPVAYRYTADVEEDIPPEYSDYHILRHYLRFRVQLTIYIIEEPLELPRHRIPLYMAEMDHFCCVVFAFDIRRPSTHFDLTMHLESYRLEGFPLSECFIVGNKYDEGVLEDSISRYEYEAASVGVRYFKCSAKTNVGVEPLLSEIKKFAIAERYWNG